PLRAGSRRARARAARGARRRRRRLLPALVRRGRGACRRVGPPGRAALGPRDERGTLDAGHPGAARPGVPVRQRARRRRRGGPAALGTEVVDEAVRHGIPFASPRALKTLVRSALAARIPTMAPLGAGSRTVAIVGAAGAGKTTAAVRLAAAYRSAGTPVRELMA